jgi:2,4-dienoyl-CoA reductase-like NADH-dependent reductase (Old Yellow Enzyme family)
MSLDLSPLYTPFRLGRLELPNRFVLPGMQRQWCEDGRPLPKLGEYYRRCVEGGVGLVITESCAVDHTSSTQVPFFVRLTPDTAEAWAGCVQEVKAAGGLMLMQLWHEGAIRQEGGEGPWAQYPTLSPSGLAHGARPNGRAATAQELEDIKQAFVRSALLAKQIGADGVEVHAAHGYLLDQFLWAETNRRTDGYGGDRIEDRVRFPAEIVAAVRKAVGPDFLIGLRFSQWKEVNYNARVADTPAELDVMLKALRQAGADVFHASARRFWVPEWPDSDLGVAGWTKSLTDAPVIAVGSVGLDIDVMENFFGQEAKSTGEEGLRELVRRFGNGEFDLISVGRGHIGDQGIINKMRDGRLADIRGFTRKDVLGDLELEGGIQFEAHQGGQDA